MVALYRPGPDTEGVVSSQDRTHAAFGNVYMSTMSWWVVMSDELLSDPKPWTVRAVCLRVGKTNNR